MLARIPELIEAITETMTLEEGDVILTGTPDGIGPVAPGDIIRAGITGLLEINFAVIADSAH
jgi:acylpyruvate hydrolase